MNVNPEPALKYAIELAKTNLENITEFVAPELVVDFIQKVFEGLTAKERK